MAAFAGYDNMEVNLEPVLDYLKAQNHKALEHEQSAKRVAGMNKWEVSTVVTFVAGYLCLLTHGLPQLPISQPLHSQTHFHQLCCPSTFRNWMFDLALLHN